MYLIEFAINAIQMRFDVAQHPFHVSQFAEDDSVVHFDSPQK